MDNALPFGYTHRNKRSHAEMDLEDSASPHWSPFNNRLSVAHDPSDNNAFPHPQRFDPSPPYMDDIPRRYPGDGMDYRTPASSSNVIDLTNEDAGLAHENRRQYQDRAPAPRPPRFGREIMTDVIDLDPEESSHRPPPRSPEIQFVSSRPIDRQNEVEFLSENPLPEARRRRMIDLADEVLPNDVIQTLLGLPNLRRQIERTVQNEQGRRQAERQRQATMERFLNAAHAARGAARGRAPRGPVQARARTGHIHVGFMAPQMQYGNAAFDLGLTRDDDDDPPLRPTYEAPSKAPEGFTRSPQEEGALICPNCEDELCVGESDLKKQAWIVKGCGHVYCGECTANRYLSKSSAKGKEKQPTSRKFKECVVQGCQKKVSNAKSMVQIFM